MSLDHPLISVVIVTHRRLEYLKLTLDSIVNQTYSCLEIIVVADGHEANTQWYIESLKDQRISYFFVDHCGYPAKGRNLGIKVSSGAYLAFCDDDDLWLPTKIEKQLSALHSNENVSLCCTDRSTIDSDGIGNKKRRLKFKPRSFNRHKLLISNFISYSSVLTKKDIVVQVGGFIDDPKFKAVEDYHLWLKIAALGEIYFLNEVLTMYRVHDSNISGSLFRGTQKVIYVFKDIFANFDYSFAGKLIAYMLIYIKYCYYAAFNGNK